MPDHVTVKFALPTAELDALENRAKRRGIPVTQALRQALQVDELLQEFEDRGAKFFLHTEKQGMQQVVFKAAEHASRLPPRGSIDV